MHGLAFELIQQGEAARNWIADGGCETDINARRRADRRSQRRWKSASLARRLATTANLEREQSTLAVAQALRSSGITLFWMGALPGGALAKSA